MTEKATLPKSYPWTTRLSDVDVTFRPMTAADRDPMLAFTRSLPEHSLLFLPIDVTSERVIDDWTRDLETGKTVTLLAEEGGALVGYASVQRSPILWTRHLGDVHLLVSPNYRGKGIGGQLARQIFERVKGLDLQKLVVSMLSSQRGGQSLFHHLGFIPEAMLNDWAIDRNGRTHDLIVMSREIEGAI